MDPQHQNRVKRQRSSRACGVCRARKIRCDSDKKFPCSNCVTFNCECTFPEPKRPKKQVHQPLSITTILPPTNAAGQPQEPIHTIQHPYHGYMDSRTMVPVEPMRMEYPEPPYPYAPPPPTQPPGGQQYRPFYPQMGHQGQSPIPPPALQPAQAPPPPPAVSSRPSELNDRPTEPRFASPYNTSSMGPFQPFKYAPSDISSPGFGARLQDEEQFYVPQDPIKNISSRNFTPIFDMERNTFQSETENGVKICLDRKLSEFFYFGESSCYKLLQGSDEQNDHYNVPEVESTKYKQPLRKPKDIPSHEVLGELAVLKIKRAFELPSKFICSLLIESYFDNVYAQVPIIDKESFLRHFNDPNPKKHPPIMLLQAVLLVGSRTCKHPAILDEDGGISTVSGALYLRTRAFCDTSLKFEYVGDSDTDDDGHVIFNNPTVLVQTLALLSWYWDAPEDVSRGSYFVVKNAINIAQSYGFHKDMESSVVVKGLLKRYQNSKIITPHKIRQQCYYWKKLWWWLFTRDRSLSMSYGRPLAIDMKGCEIKMITEEDYELYESEWSKGSEKDRLVRDFYITLIKISEIIGLILHEHYGLHESKHSERKYNVVKQLNFLMRHFLRELPEKLRFNPNSAESMNIYSYLIGSLYYVALYHINRVMLVTVNRISCTNIYWGICFQSACIFSTIIQYFLNRTSEEEKLAAPFQLMYSTSMFMVFLSYHTQSANHIVAKTATKQMDAFIDFLEHCNHLWPSITYLLTSFFEDYSNDDDSQFPIRAKQLIFKICVQYQSDINHAKKKAPDINFLLNQQGTRQDGDQFKLDDLDFSDTHLPLYKVRTMAVPSLQTAPDFFRDFTPVQLFPSARDRREKPSATTPAPETPGPTVKNEKSSEEPSFPTPPTMDSVDGGSAAGAAYVMGTDFDRDNAIDMPADFSAADGALMTPSDLNLMFDNDYFLTASSGIDWYNIS